MQATTPPNAAEYRPRGQAVPVEAVDPTGQNAPGDTAHAEHAVAPPELNFPATHVPEQAGSVAPVVVPNLPGGQGVHAEASFKPRAAP